MVTYRAHAAPKEVLKGAVETSDVPGLPSQLSTDSRVVHVIQGGVHGALTGNTVSPLTGFQAGLLRRVQGHTIVVLQRQ